MKWGVRRYQNPDGSLTEEGRKRFLNSDGSLKPNKKINVRDYNANRVLSKQKKRTDKIYTLSKNQKKYMDEAGNLTLEGARKTLPVGHDLSKYKNNKKLKKESEAYSSSWKKYFNDKTDKNYKEFKKNEKAYFDKIDEVDLERGREYILKYIK